MALTGGYCNMKQKKTMLPIAIGYYNYNDSLISRQECINIYPYIPIKSGTISNGALLRTPGVAQFDTLTGGVNRGLCYSPGKNKLYVVNGNTLYVKTNAATNSVLGTIEGTGQVSMADNGTTLAIIVPSGKGYFYDEALGLVEITDAVFADFALTPGGVTSVCLKDTIFVYTTATEFFSGSPAAVNGGKNFDALDFEDAEVSSDNNVRAFTIRNELYIAGTDTIEVYQNVGGTNFPFQRILGATIPRGLTSRFGFAEIDGGFCFLGKGANEKPAIWFQRGSQTLKISTGPIDAIIQDYAESQLATVTSWAYSEDGSMFVGWNFPNETLVYDEVVSTIQGSPVWHIRKTGSTRCRIENVTNAFGYNICGDATGTQIGVLSRDYLTEYGTAMTRTFAGPYLIDDEDIQPRMSISSVELITKTGYGNEAGNAGDDPMIEMQFSNNRGATWISMGTRSLGKEDEFLKKQVWRRIGRVQHDVLFRFITSAPIAVEFYSLEVKYN